MFGITCNRNFTRPKRTGWTHTQAESLPAMTVVRPGTLHDHA